MSSRTARRAAPASALDLDRLLLYGVALATAVAGLGHLSAAGDHPAHAHITAFFVVVALAQLAWAAAIAWRPNERWLRAGLLGNAVVIGTWVISRTTGIPFVPGAGDAEAVAVKDAVTTLLELMALGAGGLLLVLPAEVRRAQIPSPDRAVAALIAAALLLALPAALGPNGHGAGHGEHGKGEHALVAGAAVHAEPGHAGGASGHEAGGQVVSHDVEHVAAPDGSAGHAGHVGSAGHAGHAGDAPAGTADDGHGGPGHEGHQSSDPGAAAAQPPPGQVTSVRYGPFVLPPASTNGARHEAVISNTVLTQLPPPCRDCYLTAVDFDLVYGDGRAANYDTGAMLHHHVMFNSAENDPTCGRFDPGVGFLGRRILAAGNERTSGAFPRGFGYRVGANDWWSGIFEIMNVVEAPQTVWVDLSVRYLPAADKGVKPIEPIWLDIDNCEDSEVDVPAGRTTTSWDWTSDITGRVVFAAGHVHDGGVSTTLSNAGTGAHVCRSVAGYGTKPAFQGHIESMSVCPWDRIGTVRDGEVLRLDTVYDTPEPLEDVMGIMMIWVYETDDLAGGTPAPASVTSPPEGGAPPPSANHQH